LYFTGHELPLMGIWKMKLKATEKVVGIIIKRKRRDFYSPKSLGFITVT